MDEMSKSRWGLLRIYADLDKEYRQLNREIGRAEINLINQEFTPEQVKIIRSAIRAYNSANRRLVQLACERMIFQSELERE